MKHTFFVILIVLTLCFPVNIYAADEIIGTWQLVDIWDNSEHFQVDDSTQNSFVVFSPSGKAIISLVDTAECDWTQIGSDQLYIVDENGDAIKGQIKSSVLYLTYGNYRLAYTKVADGTIPTRTIAESAKEFLGEWVCKRFILEDNVYGASVFSKLYGSFSLSVEISDELIYLTITVNGETETLLSATRFENGILYLNNTSSGIAQVELLDSQEIMITAEDVTYLLAKETDNNTDVWSCQNCGATAHGNFCSNCGTPYNTQKQNSQTYKKELSYGEYIVGEDIPAGTYIITCIELNDSHTEYMNAMGDLATQMEDGGDVLSAYFKAMGALNNDPTTTISVIDNTGKTLKKSSIKKGEKVTFHLQENTTFIISDGKCSLQLQ